MQVQSQAYTRSTDRWLTWTLRGEQYFSKDITFSSTNPDLVMCCGDAEEYGIHISSDGGQTWTSSTAGLEGDNFNWVEIDPEHPQLAYTCSNNGFFRSFDRGLTWNLSNEGIVICHIVSMESAEHRSPSWSARMMETCLPVLHRTPCMLLMMPG